MVDSFIGWIGLRLCRRLRNYFANHASLFGQNHHCMCSSSLGPLPSPFSNLTTVEAGMMNCSFGGSLFMIWRNSSPSSSMLHHDSIMWLMTCYISKLHSGKKKSTCSFLTSMLHQLRFFKRRFRKFVEIVIVIKHQPHDVTFHQRPYFWVPWWYMSLPWFSPMLPLTICRLVCWKIDVRFELWKLEVVTMSGRNTTATDRTYLH